MGLLEYLVAGSGRLVQQQTIGGGRSGGRAGIPCLEDGVLTFDSGISEGSPFR